MTTKPTQKAPARKKAPARRPATKPAANGQPAKGAYGEAQRERIVATLSAAFGVEGATIVRGLDKMARDGVKVRLRKI